MNTATAEPKTAPRLVDIDGAADYLAVTPRLVRAMVSERRIPYLKIGKYVRLDLDELDTWLDEQRIETGGR